MKKILIPLILFLLVFSMVVLGAPTYVPIGPDTEFTGDIGIPIGFNYYIGDTILDVTWMTSGWTFTHMEDTLFFGAFSNVFYVKFGNLSATSAPTVNDDVDLDYVVGSRWIDVTADKEYICLDNTNGAAVWTETTGAGGAGYTNLTEFVDQNTWKVFYSDGSGDVIELALGADGTYLESKGAATPPVFSVPAGAGDVLKVGTPADSQIGVWTGDGTIEGDASLTYDRSNLQLTGDIGSTGTRITKGWFIDLQVTNAIVGSVTGSSGSCTGESATVATITGLAPDTATTQATQASITTCVNLVSIGTIATGVWEGTDVGVAYGGTGVSTGAMVNFTSILNAGLYVGRDADNNVSWAVDDTLGIKIGGVLISIVDIETGVGDNDSLVTQGYVDDIVAGADVSLSNLAAVAINASLISDTADTYDLGSATFEWLTVYLGTYGTIYFGVGQSESIAETGVNALLITATDGVSFSDEIWTTDVVGRDTDNYIGWGVDDSLAIKIGGNAYAIVDIAQGIGDNDSLCTEGYADDIAGGATIELDNLGVVAINTSLLSDAQDTDSLGSTTKEWLNGYFGDAGKIFLGLGQDTSIHRSAANTLTLTASSGVVCSAGFSVGGDIILGANSIGRDADNDIDFETDNRIMFRTSGVDGMEILSSGELDMNANSVGFTMQTLTGDGTDDIDWKLGNKMQFTCPAGDETFTFTAPTNPCHLWLEIIQDGVGSRDITWPASVKWWGTEPTWSDGGADKTIGVAFWYNGTDYWAQGTPWEG